MRSHECPSSYIYFSIKITLFICLHILFVQYGVLLVFRLFRQTSRCRYSYLRRIHETGLEVHDR